MLQDEDKLEAQTAEQNNSARTDRRDSRARLSGPRYIRDSAGSNGTDENFLATLGVRNFDLFLVAIGDDFQSSLETTPLLKEMCIANKRCM